MSPSARAESPADSPAARKPSHAADRLVTAVDRLGSPACVGLDPVLERLPHAIDQKADAVVRIERFCEGVLDAVSTAVPCVKFQSACFERYRGAGVGAMWRLIARARGLGLEVILDAKRGDIGISAAHYASGLEVDGSGVAADWMTVSPYLGADSLEPFLVEHTGVFVLVRTSNPGGDDLQQIAGADGRHVSEAVADMVSELGASRIGARGYSSVGAVVGATRPESAAALRARMPEQLFLVPGYGAQGAGAEEIRPCFREGGTGAIVTASRSVIYAFERTAADWTAAVKEAAARFAQEIRDVATSC